MNPVLLIIVTSGLLSLIAWAWYAVFSPLFEDPQSWIAKERAMRRAVVEVLTGTTSEEGQKTTLPPWPLEITGTQREPRRLR